MPFKSTGTCFINSTFRRKFSIFNAIENPSLNQKMLQKTSDIDPTETAEWREAFQGVVAAYGPERARYLLDQMVALAHQSQIEWSPELVTPYVNTIPVQAQQPYPGDLAIEEKLASLMRWNALAMVAKANGAYGELGGHIASYASAI